VFCKILKISIDFFFPKRCINCGSYGSHLCSDCLSLIDLFLHLNCPFCGKVVQESGSLCKNCKSKHYLDRTICATSYQNPIVKKSIHYFKYSPYLKDLAFPLSSLIISHLFLTNNNKNFKEYIFLPVPLSSQKQRKRGYNQSEILGKILAQKLEAFFVPDIIIKTKNTPSQITLTREERIKNVQGIFSLNPSWKKKILNKKFVIVDDVFTTGATLDEIAKLLKQNGAKEVIGMTVAKE